MGVGELPVGWYLVTDLRRCPFCGGELGQRVEQEPTPKNTMCLSCGITGSSVWAEVPDANDDQSQ